MQLPTRVYVSVQDIDSNHTGVHGIWVFLHGSRRDRFPGVTAKTESRHKVVRLCFLTGFLLTLNTTHQLICVFKAVQFLVLDPTNIVPWRKTPVLWIGG